MTTAMDIELSGSRIRFAIDNDEGDEEAGGMESDSSAMEESRSPTQLSSSPEQQNTNDISKDVTNAAL